MSGLWAIDALGKAGKARWTFSVGLFHSARFLFKGALERYPPSQRLFAKRNKENERRGLREGRCLVYTIPPEGLPQQAIAVDAAFDISGA
ncbi:hypothetical protein [Iodidimonas gelatinilytica]|uniref:hypothetical protein n=1 Tax=Iodidimonas gelatinilytica TaxID=1236966 RepID=UPI001B2FE4BB|nr:hypothetical protein [Iodidimonas gelatinilytica]